MLEFLFNVAPHRLAGARLETVVSPGVLLVLIAAAVALALLASGYLGTRSAPGLAWLRAALAGLAVFALAEPAVRVPVSDAASGPVIVLLDDSLSMGIADGPRGETRGALLEAAFAPGTGALLAELESRAQVRVMRFGGRTVAADRPGPRFAQALSDPIGALLDAMPSPSGAAAGLVLVSDGGQRRGRDVADALTRLRAAGLAVHVVGVGATTLRPDLSVDALWAPDSVLVDDTVDLRIALAANGMAGEAVTLTVREEGALLAERTLTLDGDPARATEVIAVPFAEAGLRRVEVEARTASDERVVENNRASRLLDVRDAPVRILHLEGEPRFEVKFVRRALAGDPVLSLASLVRTGDNRYLRLGVEDPDELARGFPGRAEDLFPYRVLILGSLEAAALDASQLALLERYVAERGASILLLGGRRALAEGGFADTRLARLSPVVLETAAPEFRTAVPARVTRAGTTHPITRELFTVPRAVPLPALAVVNPVRRVKPGASVLLEGDDGGAAPLVLLAHHRFGRGRVAVLAARDSWRWRMHADVPPDDRTHELLWRRLLRWLARDVPDRIELESLPRVAAPGEDVRVRATVRDAEWKPVPDARVQVRVVTPLGELESRDLLPSPAGDGTFTGGFTAIASGVHEVRLSAADAGAESTASGGFAVAAQGEEYRHAALDEGLLRRIAEATGGSYRHLSSAAGLGERVLVTAPAAERWERVALWNAPALLLVLLALACGEWWLRRRRRLP